MKEGLFFIFLLIITASILDTITQLFLKSAINSLEISVSVNIEKIKRFILSLIRLPQAWIALMVSIPALCIWLYVLSKVDLNLAFSVGSVHYIFIAFSSRFLLKEKFGLTRWLGIFCIVIGIILVGIS